jgi:hypothetical protein
LRDVGRVCEHSFDRDSELLQQVNSFLSHIGYLAAFEKVFDVNMMFSVLDLGLQLFAVLSAFFKLQFLQLFYF